MRDSGGVLDHPYHQLIISFPLDCLNLHTCVASNMQMCAGVCAQELSYMYESHLYDNGKTASFLHCVGERAIY